MDEHRGSTGQPRHGGSSAEPARLHFTASVPVERLDLFLPEILPEITRSRAKTLIESGHVRVGGHVIWKPSRPVRPGEVVEVEIPPPAPVEAIPEEIPLHIVYEDSDVIVINKQRGLVVHPAPGHRTGTLVNALLAHCGDLAPIGDRLRPGIVHRLDKDTSGLMVVAKNEESYRSLAEQVKSRKVGREYLAVVEGVWTVAGGRKATLGAVNGEGGGRAAFRPGYVPPLPSTRSVPGHEWRVGDTGEVQGTVITLIGRHPKDRKRMAVLGVPGADECRLRGREAITRYRVLEELGRRSLVNCSIETGRTHQIRVHMAYIGHPVTGDRVYGRKEPEAAISGQALHAFRLRFVHPRTTEAMEFEAPLPSDMQLLLEQERRRLHSRP